MRLAKITQLAIVATSLVFGFGASIERANAAGAFEKRFTNACRADDNSTKECKCRYSKLRKPKNKNQETLVIAMLEDNDDKVQEMIKNDASFRMIGIINSMTRGLATCGF